MSMLNKCDLLKNFTLINYQFPVKCSSPEEHQNSVYEAFCDFVDEFAYEYDAIARDPPKDLNAAAQAAWIQQNKRKVFLGKFPSRNLQKHFEEAVPADQRSAMTFDNMVATLKTHYDGGRNKTLANFEFHKLYQKNDESSDAFTSEWNVMQFNVTSNVRVLIAMCRIS